VAALVSTCVFEFGVFTAHLDSHGCGLAVPIPPKPSVFVVKCRDDLALVARRTGALFIGHRIALAMAVHVEVHTPAIDQHSVFFRLALFHDQLPLGTVAGCKRKGGFVAPDLDLLRVCRTGAGS